jgi:hypothetical protein
MSRLSIAAAVLAVSSLANSHALAAGVDTNLGSLAAGSYPLTGTTVGADNDIDTYSILNQAAIWDQDYIYQFTTTAPLTASLTSNDPDSTLDNDFFLLPSLTTTVNASNLRSATVVPGQIGGVYINGSFGAIPPGTYYLVIDAWRGDPATSGTPASGRAAAFAATLTLTGAASAIYSSSLGGGPTFTRPSSTGAAGTTPGFFYHVQPFYVTQAGTYAFEQTSSFDDYMFLYSPSFDPANPTANFIEGDDDDGAGNDSRISRALTPGVQYFMVNTSFDPSITGAFTVNGTFPAGAPPIMGLIPEPTTLAGLAAVGLIALRRKR